MSKRPTRRMHHPEESVHLNITPFIDILVCLILFLLSSAAVLKLAVVDTALPKLADASIVQDKQPEKEQLVVTVAIQDGGFLVGRVGQDNSADRQRRWKEGGDFRASIPRSGQQFNFAALTQHLARIKQAYPDALSVMLLPDDTVSYNTIVEAMDASREMIQPDKKKVLLFPDAVIGHMAEGK